jgi:hypothetical protein
MDKHFLIAAVELTERTCGLTHRLLSTQRSASDDWPRLVMLAHLLRMLRFVQGAATLVRSGNLEPACVLARTVLEMGWVMLAIKTDPTRIEEWREQANSEARKSIRRLMQLGEHERTASMSDALLEAAIANMPVGKKADLKRWADASGAGQAYPTIYQQLSDCAHSEMPATLAYVHWDEKSGMPTHVQDADLDELPADSLNICVALLHDGLRYLAGPTMAAVELAELEELEILRKTQTGKLDEERLRHLNAKDDL